MSDCDNTECPSLPLKQEEVDIIVALGEEVSKDSRWVAATDLVGRQPKVNTFHKVPKLSDQVLAEFPKAQKHKSEIMEYSSGIRAYQFRIQKKKKKVELPLWQVEPVQSIVRNSLHLVVDHFEGKQ